MTSELRKELGALIRRFEGLTAGVPLARTARNRRRRQRRKARAGQTRAAMPGVIAPVVQDPTVGRGRRSRRRRNGRGSTIEGQARIRRTELLQEVKVTTSNNAYVGNTGALSLSVRDFTWLKTLAGAFDRVTWHYMRVFWKPAVGTTTDGLFALGIDWNLSTRAEDVTRAKVLACQPVMDVPVWQPAEIVCPAAKLMSRKEYVLGSPDLADIQPGRLLYDVPKVAKVFGEIWIEYDVTLFGTSA